MTPGLLKFFNLFFFFNFFLVSRGIEVVRVNDTWMTPGHPAFLNNNWQLPSNLISFIKHSQSEFHMEVEEVFNFVLESRSSLIVNGLEVSTLGQFCFGM